MRQSRLVAITANSILLALAGCGQAHRDAAAAKMSRDNEPAADAGDDLSTEDRLRGIARQLRGGELTAIGGLNRAIFQCFAVAGPRLDVSDAASAAPHGMKIYQPWAKDAEAYLLAASKDQPVGQIIVKESWTSREVAQIATDEAAAGFYAERDGKYYKPDRPKELFIMFKDDPATAETDAGWIYGVVTHDGKEVISSGCISACVNCHRQARHDRVFGQKPKPE